MYVYVFVCFVVVVVLISYLLSSSLLVSSVFIKSRFCLLLAPFFFLVGRARNLFCFFLSRSHSLGVLLICSQTAVNFGRHPTFSFFFFSFRDFFFEVSLLLSSLLVKTRSRNTTPLPTSAVPPSLPPSLPSFLPPLSSLQYVNMSACVKSKYSKKSRKCKKNGGSVIVAAAARPPSLPPSFVPPLLFYSSKIIDASATSFPLLSSYPLSPPPNMQV